MERNRTDGIINQVASEKKTETNGTDSVSSFLLRDAT